jgi:hypothetical protein
MIPDTGEKQGTLPARGKIKGRVFGNKFFQNVFSTVYPMVEITYILLKKYVKIPAL